MFSPLTRTYASGFSRTINDPKTVLDITPDSEVVQLFEELTAGSVSVNNWAFLRRLVMCARRVFNDDLRTWLKSQETNSKLTDNTRGLLNDTVAFINTGLRPVSLGSRTRVIVREKNYEAPTGPGAVDVIADRTTNPLTQWLRREDAVVDLVFTLNMLFGKGLSS
jgi:hypothetical protein